MPKYTVVQPIRTEDGLDRKAGDVVELSERQAKYLRLGGKIEPTTKQPAQKPKKEK